MSDTGTMARARRPGGTRAFLAIVLLLSAFGAPLSAQLVAAGRQLYVARTAYFDIYYPAELRAQAGRLASFADSVRAGLVPLFDATAAPRLPVLLIDGQAETNGYFTIAPSYRIVLYISAVVLDESIGGFNDDLRKLFLHELAHYLSLTRMNAPWKTMDAIFGDLASPAYWMSPLNFTEGATVSAESDDGYGRIDDPEALGIVSQSLIEGKRPGYWQTAGARDLYPFGSQYYLFGGAFVTWLRARHGQRAYAAFWTRLGEGRLDDSMEGDLLSRSVFGELFGESLETAWQAFLDEATPRTPPPDLSRRLVRAPGRILAMAVGDTWIYWADASKGWILRMDSKGGKPERVIACDGSVNALSLSPDEKSLLVSASETAGPGSRLIVREYDLSVKRFLEGTQYGIREAAYLRAPGSPGDFVAIAMRGLQTDCVLVSLGKARVLLRGNEELAYGSPQSADGSELWAIAKVSGVKRIMRIAAGSDGTPDPAGAEFLAFPTNAAFTRGSTPVKNLSLDSRGLVFSYAVPLDQELAFPGFALYRIATLEPLPGGGMLLSRSKATVSGGANMGKRDKDGALFYMGRFYSGEYPCAAPNGSAAPGGSDSDWLRSEAVFDPAPAPLVPSPSIVSALETKEYPAPAYPLLFRSMRRPYISPDLDSAGIEFQGQDLPGRLSWLAGAGYSWGAGAANLSLSLAFPRAPLSLSLSGGDRFDLAADRASYVRQSSLALGATLDLPSWPGRRELSFGAFCQLGLLAAPAAGAPYASGYDYSEWALGASASLSDLRTPRFPPFVQEGYALSITADMERPSFGLGSPMAVGMALELHSGPLRTGLWLWGMASLDGSPRFATSGRYFLSEGEAYHASIAAPWPAYHEYLGVGSLGSLYAQGQVECLLLPIEIQARFLWGFYLRRLGLSLGARGAYIGGIVSDTAAATGSGAPILLASAYASLSMEAAPLAGSLARIGLIPRAELSWALTGAYVTGSPIALRFTLGSSY